MLRCCKDNLPLRVGNGALKAVQHRWGQEQGKSQSIAAAMFLEVWSAVGAGLWAGFESQHSVRVSGWLTVNSC